MNKWQFSDELVTGEYNACIETGIAYSVMGIIAANMLLIAMKLAPVNFVMKKTFDAAVEKVSTKLPD